MAWTPPAFGPAGSWCCVADMSWGSNAHGWAWYLVDSMWVFLRADPQRNRVPHRTQVVCKVHKNRKNGVALDTTRTAQQLGLGTGLHVLRALRFGCPFACFCGRTLSGRSRDDCLRRYARAHTGCIPSLASTQQWARGKIELVTFWWLHVCTYCQYLDSPSQWTMPFNRIHYRRRVW